MAVFDGLSFFPFQMPMLALRIDPENTTAFHAETEEKVLAAFKPSLVTKLDLKEFKVLCVIAARCHSKTSPESHSAWITNKFIQEFSGLRQSEVDEAVNGLAEDWKLIRFHKPTPKAVRRRYWLTTLDGEAFHGQPVHTHENKPANVKAGYKGTRKAKATVTEEDVPKGKWLVSSVK
jgi:hypothetical protein